MTARAELARKVARMWEEQLTDSREAADAWRRVLRMRAGDAEAAAGLERAKQNMLKKPDPGASDAYAPPKLAPSVPPMPAASPTLHDAEPLHEAEPPLGAVDDAGDRVAERRDAEGAHGSAGVPPDRGRVPRDRLSTGRLHGIAPLVRLGSDDAPTQATELVVERARPRARPTPRTRGPARRRARRRCAPSARATSGSARRRTRSR